MNTRFTVIVNYYLSVCSHVPLCYIDKLNSDNVFLCNICTTWVLDVNFSHDASGKYCIYEATVDGAQYCETHKLYYDPIREKHKSSSLDYY